VDPVPDAQHWLWTVRYRHTINPDFSTVNCCGTACFAKHVFVVARCRLWYPVWQSGLWIRNDSIRIWHFSSNQFASVSTTLVPILTFMIGILCVNLSLYRTGVWKRNARIETQKTLQSGVPILAFWTLPTGRCCSYVANSIGPISVDDHKQVGIPPWQAQSVWEPVFMKWNRTKQFKGLFKWTFSWKRLWD
jgi:hypothetical protein